MENKTASILNRFVAFIIDWYLSSLAAAIPVIILQSVQAKDFVLINRLDGLSAGNAWIACILAITIYILYYCVLPVKTWGQLQAGQTPGRKLMKIRLIKTDDSSPVFRDLLLRDFVGVLLLQGYITSASLYIISLIQISTGSYIVPYVQVFYYATVLISLILYMISKKKYLLHDLLSKTVIVIYKPDSR